MVRHGSVRRVSARLVVAWQALVLVRRGTVRLGAVPQGMARYGGQKGKGKGQWG